MLENLCTQMEVLVFWRLSALFCCVQEAEKKPEHPALTEGIWMAANFLSQTFPSFANLHMDVMTKIRIQLGDYDHTININVQNTVVNKKKWNDILTDLEKLIIFKALREEKVCTRSAWFSRSTIQFLFNFIFRAACFRHHRIREGKSGQGLC